MPTPKKIESTEETIRLTPEQMEAIRLADQAFERGEALTSEEVRELSRQRTLKWVNPKIRQSA